MQTKFSQRQLRDPDVAASEQILRKCVHCGFCTATCPTYVLLGDELDSPRGRIYLIKDMLENERPATAEVVKHIDRCLSCLACMTTCPSGVHYQHLIDHARVHVEETYRRPWTERLMRAALAAVLPYPARFRVALGLARLARPVERRLPARLRGMLALVPPTSPKRCAAAGGSRGAAPETGTAQQPARKVGTARELAADVAAARQPASNIATARKTASGTVTAARKTAPGIATTQEASPRSERRGGVRVALLGGCVQSVLSPEINAAAARLLTRAGAEVVHVKGCCGAIVHHLGRDADGRNLATSLMRTLEAELDNGGLDAIVVTASGCGTHVKDYGYIFREDEALAARAAEVSERTRDITEMLDEIGMAAPPVPAGLKVAYHSACSMQHGQKVETPPRALLARAGYIVEEVPEGHLCCGSAGTYNLLQPELARRLRERKLTNIGLTNADVVATGNIGCITQLSSAASLPVVHTIELLDWASGGPRPEALEGLALIEPAAGFALTELAAGP